MEDERKYHSWSRMSTAPFYAIPSNVKSSSEIINEARAAVKPIDTKRPFTPRVNHRQLFGKTSWSDRPSSSCVLENIFYDGNVPSLSHPTYARLSPLNSPRKKGKDQANTVRPSSHLGPLPEESLVVRKISSAPSKVRLPALDGGRHCGRHPCHVDFLERRSLTLQEGDAKSLRYALKMPLELSKNSAFDDVQMFASISAAKAEFNLDAKILPLLNKLTLSKEETAGDVGLQLVPVVRQLYDVLMAEQLLGKNFRQRSAILRAAFLLLDCRSVPLRMELVRLCLVLNVSGKNLLLISKVIFKLTRHDVNDRLFLENNLLELLLESVANASPLRDTEALVYNIGSLKFLAMNVTLLVEISRLKCIHILTSHMNRINEYKNASGRVSEQTARVLFQVTGCLRNLAESGSNRHAFVKSNAVGEMCEILRLFSDDYDIVMNVARILSKLTMYYEVCNAVTENTDCFPAALNLMEKYKHRPELVVRLCFAFGNVTAKNEDARIYLFQHPKCLDVLLELIQLHLKSDMLYADGFDRRRELNMFTCSVAPTPTVADEEDDNNASVSDDVVVKAIRLVANLSVSNDVGRRIATNNGYLSLLVNLLVTKNVERNEELVLSAAGALSNVSYYLTEMPAFPPIKPEQLVECMFGLLGCENLEALIECLRILGNISREEQIRRLLATRKVLETAIQLTESDNKDVIYLSCGLLMNFMVDKANRTAMRDQRGDSRLIRVLKDYGPKDWQLATVICQTLWNYSCIEETSACPFLPNDAVELLDILQTYLDENAALDGGRHHHNGPKPFREIAHDIWLLEFSPVATRLAERIRWYR